MLNSLSAELGHVLLLYGGWGLLAMSFLDSSFIPFPVLNDLALILMASQRPEWWPLFAIASALGSLAGTYLFYGIARGGGGYIWRKTTPAAVTYAQGWLKRNDFVAILVAALLPPPAPLKAFILTAGLLRVNALRFGWAMLAARGLRFGAEAWLGAHYGVQAQDYLRHNLVPASLAVVVAVVSMALLRSWRKRTAGDSGFGVRG